jgi:hypothetical protein
MSDEIQLISDGDGVAVIGDAGAVERFLMAEGLPSRDLELPKVRQVLGAGSAAAQAGSEIAANSGRWVKLTKESAHLISKNGLRTSGKSGLSTGVIKGSKGQVKGFVEFAKGPGASLTNPAMLAGAAGIMAQLAMQQAMDEITDYLAVIDEKLDDVLRAQKDAVVADMIGVDFVIEEAMTIRAAVGGVSDVTWSKVQATSTSIARTQGYALLQLDALAEKLESKSKVADLAKVTKDAEPAVKEWLAVLARCFQLQDAIAVLELDRVMRDTPDELEKHRIGLKTARQNRRDVIARSTERLMARLDAAADVANAKVLLHPSGAAAVVRSTNDVVGEVVTFHGVLGIEGDRQSVAERRWTQAADDVRVRALDSGAEGLRAGRQLGAATFSRAKSATGSLTGGVADRAQRFRKEPKWHDADEE